MPSRTCCSCGQVVAVTAEDLGLFDGHPPVSQVDVLEAVRALEEISSACGTCSARWEGYVCTRQPGHHGVHVATGGSEDTGDIFAIWQREGT
jgi:hypothetical protein